MSAVVVQIVAHGDDVFGRAHEGGRDVVHVVLHAKAEIRHVGLGQVGNVQMDVGNIDTLAVGKLAARNHRADHVGLGQLRDVQLQTAVVDEDAVTHLELGGKIGVGHGYAGRITLDLASGQREGVSGIQVDFAILERADADLGTLGVQHDRGRLAQSLAHAAEGLDDLLVGRVITVGEVETSNVHARLEHLGHDPLGGGGRAEGTYDLGFQHMATPLEQYFMLYYTTFSSICI